MTLAEEKEAKDKANSILAFKDGVISDLEKELEWYKENEIKSNNKVRKLFILYKPPFMRILIQIVPNPPFSSLMTSVKPKKTYLNAASKYYCNT